MPWALDLLREGLEHHRAGRLEEAAQLYRQALEADPQNADALHLTGMLAYQEGRLEAAAAWIERAIALRDEAAMFHNNLGTVLQALGRPAEALECFRKALGLQPDYPEAYSNAGNALQQLGRLEEALAHYEQALRLAPGCAEAHNNRGNALRQSGRYREAGEAFERALQLRPDYAEAWLNLSGALREMERLEEAEAACRKALRLNPALGEAFANLSAVLLKQHRPAEAEQAARQAVRLKPELAEGHSNLAAALIEQKRFAEAAAPCGEALRLNPRLPEAHANRGDICAWFGQDQEALREYELGLALRPASAELLNKRGFALEQLGRWDEALTCYEEAIRLKPDFAEARTNRAMAWLRKGDLARGFQEYEWRFRRRDCPPRRFSAPPWEGGSFEGRTLLVHAEQGLGDAIQFLRYLPLAERLGGRVLFECRPRLRPLVPERWLAQPGESFDLHAPLMSLPRLLGTTLETIPAEVPYLAVDAGLLERWRRKLAGAAGRKVGLVWAGNPDHSQDRKRSIPPELLAGLGAVQGVTFFSLQRGWRPPAAGLEIHPLEEEEGLITDTAAAILNLDLVISVDTMVAHLAGALGRPVWVLLAFAADWRWMLDREDSPWYPTMRLFRQRRPGEWREVIARVAEALAREVR